MPGTAVREDSSPYSTVYVFPVTLNVPPSATVDETEYTASASVEDTMTYSSALLSVRVLALNA